MPRVTIQTLLSAALAALWVLPLGVAACSSDEKVVEVGPTERVTGLVLDVVAKTSSEIHSLKIVDDTSKIWSFDNRGYKGEVTSIGV